MKKILLIIVIVLSAASLVLAQEVQVRGTVTGSEDGLGLPGVMVSVRGTTTGTMTGTDGKYTLKIPAGFNTLVFSYVGMQKQEVDVAGRTVIDVTMMPDLQMMDEIVVVGYGVQSRRDVSGAISTVRGEAIRTIPVQSFDQALQGKATGVNITIPNGVLNNPPVIRIRGFNSITASSYPLVVIDGVPIFTGDVSQVAAATNALSDINPADIESMEILKDASATAIYGSRAANGVILITTRRGTGQKTRVTYDGYVGFTQPYHLFDVMNTEQWITHKNLARRNMYVDLGLDPDSPSRSYFTKISDPDGPAGNYVDTKWSDYIYQTGFQQNHAVTFSGSTAATGFFLSTGYTDQSGMIRKNTFVRKNVRLNLDHKLNKFVTLSTSFAYVNSLNKAPNTGSLEGQAFNTSGAGRLAFVTSPLVAPYNFDGTYNINGQFIGLMGTSQPEARLGYYNPVPVFKLCNFSAQTDRIMATFSATLAPVKGLLFKTVYGMDNLTAESLEFDTPVTGDGYPGGYAFNSLDKMNRWTWTNTVNYLATVADRLNINVLAGTEEQRTVRNLWWDDKSDVADPFFTTYQGSWVTAGMGGGIQEENYFISYFGRMNLHFDNRYYAEVSVRRDGFSGLAAGHKFGTFGGASLMWNISNEGFIKNGSLGRIFSDIRLKGSYGRVGNMSGIKDFGSLFLYESGLYGAVPTLTFTQAGNADLRWEASDKFDAGLSFAFLKDRIQADINWFRNDINGLILDSPQSPSKGIPNNIIPENIGSMYNTGIEISLTSFNINSSKLQWTTTFNFSTLKNEVTALAPGVTEIVGITSTLETTNRTLVGYPIGMIFGIETHGVDPVSGRRIFVDASGREVLYTHVVQTGQSKWTYRDDGSAAPMIELAKDGKPLGSPIPRFYGGLDNNLAFGNFDASLSLTYALKFYVYNGSKAGLRDQRFWNNSVEVFETAWKNPGDITNIPRPVYGDNISNGSTMVISENVERGDYMKVRSASVGYTFKKLSGKLKIERIHLYSQVFNAFVLTRYTGSDPEVSTNGDDNLTPGIDRNTVPQARTYTFGVNITF
jgi:TonB-linked SusC/RagA family outer membrane protein